MTSRERSQGKFHELGLRAEELIQLRKAHHNKPFSESPESPLRLVHEIETLHMELAGEREKYVDLYDFAPVGYLTLDEKGKITEANLTAASMLGMERGALAGTFFSSFVCEEDQDIFYLYTRALLETENSACDLSLKKKLGGLFDARLECRRVLTNQETIVCHRMAVSDITRQKNLERQIFQTQKMQSIMTMAGGLAHDFNNIFYVVLGNTELAMDDVPRENPAWESLEAIQSVSLRGAGIIKQLLNFSRRSDVGGKLLDGVSIIRDLFQIEMFDFPASIEIRKYLPEEEIRIFADPVQIHQALFNICINACQSIQEKKGLGQEGQQKRGILEIKAQGITLDQRGADRYEDLKAGDYLKIIISDTGLGIPTENIDKIFDPYFTTKDVSQGSGLGLSVVHGIVKSHGGDVAVESVPGRGSAFTILLPAVVGQ